MSLTEAATRGEPSARLRSAPLADRVLVIRLGALGDVVRTRFAFPGVRALYPRARIDWLVEDRAAAGLSGIAGLDEIIQIPRRELRRSAPAGLWRIPRDLIAELRARRYTLALDFHSALKSAALAWAAGIPRRVGYGPGVAREGSHRLQTDLVRIADPHISRFERNAALVRFLGGEVPETPPPLELPAGPDAEVSGLPADFVALHPGTSSKAAYKRWAPERFAGVARRLSDENGWSAVVTHGPVPGERELAEQVVALAGASAILAPHMPSVSRLLTLLGRARLFIGGDSGPMHLAALAGVPTIAIFGPTDPVENAPFPGIPAQIVRRDVGCNPCREGCPALSCMDAVGVDDVVAAAQRLVAARSRGD